MLILAHCRKQEHCMSASQAMIWSQQLAFMQAPQGGSPGLGLQPPPIGLPPWPGSVVEVEIEAVVLLPEEVAPPCDEVAPPWALGPGSVCTSFAQAAKTSVRHAMPSERYCAVELMVAVDAATPRSVNTPSVATAQCTGRAALLGRAVVVGVATGNANIGVLAADLFDSAMAEVAVRVGLAGAAVGRVLK